MNMVKKLKGIKYITKTDVDYAIQYESGEKAKINILNSHVFRYYISPTHEFCEYPKPHNCTEIAKINVKRVDDYDKEGFIRSGLKSENDCHIIYTDKIEILFDKIRGTMNVYDKRTNKDVLKEYETLSYTDRNTTQCLYQNEDEYFFGGGMQNGRFSHKGNVIEIINTNVWTDGGVASPCPFYWSTYGYGVLRNTWQPGLYDFGSESPNFIKNIHEEEYFDAFYFINIKPSNILKDFYELTGQPICMPEYAFYQAHLNTFNRDYWVEVKCNTSGSILFEDGKYYKRYKPNAIGDKNGILESLNGEKNNYQFSARAMIDRYKKHDMPLGWFIPNDGYGSGYGQTDSLDGDINNLKQFADYSRNNGVEVALWTESNLHPCDPDNPKKGERDLGKEVGIAGVVALKCDVAWIGYGYSFGLTAVENAANVFVKETKHNVRPMIIMVDGWAGTQRCAGIWSGDQSGGEWEYIRFHIPTYIGTGLSGQPVVGSDMDGIYSGGDREVNVRDYQWKTFTPLQLNMDGWGNTPKTPFSFDEECTTINRAYLKLKSMLMPYHYSIGYESSGGLPMVRAMLLEFPDERPAHTLDSQYQFMFGPSILVAPVYKIEYSGEKMIRNGVYLPDSKQIWIDFFTGEKYQGGKIIDNLNAPLWKIPVFVKDGAIIPMTNPHNNPNEINRSVRIFQLYPNGETSFEVYEDDGISSDYLDGYFATTRVTSLRTAGDVIIHVEKTKGNYKNIVKERTTLIQVIVSEDVCKLKVAINGDSIEVPKVYTDEDFELTENAYCFKNDFITNPYLADFGGDMLRQKCLLIKINKIDITSNEIQIKVKGYVNESKVFGGPLTVNPTLDTPLNLAIIAEKTTSTSISLKWDPLPNVSYYEIERDGIIFSNIIGNTKTFVDFKYESEHLFRIRAINNGVSKWSDLIEAKTKEDPFKHVITNIKVICNLPCEPTQEICKLIDGNPNSLWHTCWDDEGKANPEKGHFIKLNFDLGDVYHLDRVEYIPRNDAGNGTFLQIQYRCSFNGADWSPMSDKIAWQHDSLTKVIDFNGAGLRFLEVKVLETIGNFGSGRQMIFYKKN